MEDTNKPYDLIEEARATVSRKLIEAVNQANSRLERTGVRARVTSASIECERVTFANGRSGEWFLQTPHVRIEW